MNSESAFIVPLVKFSACDVCTYQQIVIRDLAREIRVEFGIDMAAPAFVKRVVKTCLRIQKDDRVTIFTWRHMLNLAEAFAMACRRAGAWVHTEFGTDEMFYDQLNLPVEYLEKTNPFGFALANVATANIFISGPEDPERLKVIPAERWAALSKADKPYYDKFLERKIRSAQITLGYVTPQRAKTYGFNYQAWKANMHAALDVNYKDMQKLGEKIRNTMEKACQVHITAPNGTDLTFILENRKAHVNDGVIDDNDIKEGAIFTSLPSGSVETTPIETSTNGVFISNVPEPQLGVLIHDLKWIFEDGRLKSIEGGDNVGVVKAQWEKASGDKDRLGWFGLGLNPRAEIGYVYNGIPLGTATLGVGDNRAQGGKNDSDWGSPSTIKNPTIELDGRTFIKQGVLKL